MVAEPAGAAVSGAPGSPENGPNHGEGQRCMGLSRKQLLITGIALATGLVHVLGIGHRTSGVVSRLYSSYFSDIALPFAAYFLLCASEKSLPALRPWWTKLVLVFGAATTAEILQFFGVYALGKTFDPLDVAAYATGALLAVAVERAVFAKYLRSWRL